VYEAIRQLLAAEPHIGFALVFGSCARGDEHAQSDLDLAIGGLARPLSLLELGDRIGRLEAAAGRAVDLTVLDDPLGSPTGCSATGRSCSNAIPMRSRRARRAPCSTTSTGSPSRTCSSGPGRARCTVVDRLWLAKALADVRDAVARIREVLPADADAFARDRTAREVVVLNLFVALQHCLSVATHWLAEQRLDVPAGYRDVLLALGDRGALPLELAARLAAASGLRNLIANRYGVLDWNRIHAIASTRTGDLLWFCDEIERLPGAP